MNNICKNCKDETKPDEWFNLEEKICIDGAGEDNDDYRDADMVVQDDI